VERNSFAIYIKKKNNNNPLQGTNLTLVPLGTIWTPKTGGWRSSPFTLEKPKGQTRINNPQKLATLFTPDIRRRQTTIIQHNMCCTLQIT
jgi:hypothetical protein